jgi:hypothetical protein
MVARCRARPFGLLVLQGWHRQLLGGADVPRDDHGDGDCDADSKP